MFTFSSFNTCCLMFIIVFWFCASIGFSEEDLRIAVEVQRDDIDRLTLLFTLLSSFAVFLLGIFGVITQRRAEVRELLQVLANYIPLIVSSDISQSLISKRILIAMIDDSEQTSLPRTLHRFVYPVELARIIRQEIRKQFAEPKQLDELAERAAFAWICEYLVRVYIDKEASWKVGLRHDAWIIFPMRDRSSGFVLEFGECRTFEVQEVLILGNLPFGALRTETLSLNWAAEETRTEKPSLIGFSVTANRYVATSVCPEQGNSNVVNRESREQFIHDGAPVVNAYGGGIIGVALDVREQQSTIFPWHDVLFALQSSRLTTTRKSRRVH